MLRTTTPIAMTCAAMVVFSALPAKASVIDWTLQNVVFADGGSATGTFSTDSATGNVLDFSITTTAGTKLGGTIYDPTVAQVYNNYWAPSSFDLTDEGAHVYLELAFASPLTDPGTDLLASNNPSYECDNCHPSRIAISGEAVSTVPNQIPEPATFSLMSMVLLGLGVAFRRTSLGGDIGS